MNKVEILKFLERFSDLPLVKECTLAILNESSVLKVYSKPFKRLTQLTVLQRRLQNVDVNEIIGGDSTISRMNKIETESVELVKVADDECEYSVFINGDSRKSLIGIIQNKNLNKLKLLQLQKEYVSKGYTDIEIWEN